MPPSVARFALVVDLHPWPAPVDSLVSERLARPLLEAFGTVRLWHAARPGGDPKGAEAARDPALAAVILSGSMAMVEEPEAWMAALGAALDHWMERRVPVLGTCFGHQFMAHHLGGRLGSFDERRVALDPLHVVDGDDPLLAGLPPMTEMLWTHRDRVLELPEALKVTASSSLVPVEAFRHRDLPLWGIQAHPEADGALVQAVVRVDPEASTRLRQRPWSAYDTPAAKSVLRRFAEIAEGLAPLAMD